MFALLSSVALADGFIGQASLSRAIRLKYMERTSGFGVSMLRRAVSSAAAKTACNIVAARRPRTILMLSSPGAPSTAYRLASTSMAARSQPVRSVAQTSANGLCRAALRWIGPNTQKVDMPGLSRRPSVVPAEFGRAAMSSRGSIAPVSARTESPPAALTTQTPIRDRYTQSAK
jgi:hypothetical protein